MKNLGILNKLRQKLRSTPKKIGFQQNDAEYIDLRDRIKTLEDIIEQKSNSVELAKSNFLKNIYHEIRTPLNAIVGFSNLVELNNVSENETKRYVSYIRESSKEFLRKIDDIIEASMIEAGVVKIMYEECNVYELLKETYDIYSVHKHFIDKDIAFLLNVSDENKEIIAMCDSKRMKQILGSLIVNAFKFTEKGIVEFGFKIGNEKILEFYVKDTGIGGLDGKENTIFKDFSKGDESDTSPDGLGLGLSMAQKLVSMMKGNIWYTSDISRGSTFYFSIPYLAATKIKLDNAPSSDDSLNAVIKIKSKKSVVF